MSEKIYAWLLRFYPFRFRAKYGEEALQLFRDRSRDERGFFRVARLWLDLLQDLAISVARLRRHPEPAVAAAAVHPSAAPSFWVLEPKPLLSSAMFSGGILTIVSFAVCSFLIGHAGSLPFRPSSALAASEQTGASSAAQARTPLEASHAVPSSVPGSALDTAERRYVIDTAISDLQRYYVDSAGARKMAESLRAHERAGDYDSVPDGATFADLLTRQLRETSHDLHLEVVFTQRPSPGGSAAPVTTAQQANCTFERVEILPHNTGYVKLNSFPDPAHCAATATRAMAALNHADALIFDLRDNRGGYPGMVMFLAAYLFDHPEYMYNPREDTSERSWTRSPVRGSRLADKPVYILTSARTRSAAEHFSYNLKMLKRATLIGETTGGATDVGAFHRIDNQFGIGIREAKAINPYSEPDWAVTGIQPNVKVNAGDALETAQKLAERVVKTRTAR